MNYRRLTIKYQTLTIKTLIHLARIITACSLQAPAPPRQIQISTKTHQILKIIEIIHIVLDKRPPQYQEIQSVTINTRQSIIKLSGGMILIQNCQQTARCARKSLLTTISVSVQMTHFQFHLPHFRKFQLITHQVQLRKEYSSHIKYRFLLMKTSHSMQICLLAQQLKENLSAKLSQNSCFS
ncbi:hypothetical protein FGO68_gene15689 [Halteria grandinella]|uniref:Uncharacterized protein n=1 Tax=Halteria grandinella TaxID=5974 RepID=A0A8J8SVQ8_HALGN|nr:hypothetical protein FGO68_gene15689 [Halteria grandinella]